SKEAREVSKILGVSELIQEDFGDSELKSKKAQLTTYISQLIENKRPDLVVTYDLSGLYGHDDHIAASEAVTDILRADHSNTDLWYVTFPKRTIEMIKLPEHM